MSSRAAMLACLILVWPFFPAQAGESRDFTVLRDGAPIGHHRVEVNRDGDEVKVSVDIALDVSFGFIPLYSYRHHSQEVWRGERLIRLDSRTDDNGDAFKVSARATLDGLVVDTGTQRSVMPADTVPTSYWNKALVSGRPILDSQEGRLLAVTVTPAGPARWHIRGDVDLDIAYDRDNRWSGLWFRLKGSDFTYAPSALAEIRR